MTIVAHSHSFVIGVDTHARHHVLAVLAGNGQLIDTGSFPTSRAGRAIAWAGRRTGGDLAALWVIEGIGSYGAQLAHTVTEAGYQVVEAARCRRVALEARTTSWTPAGSLKPCYRWIRPRCAIPASIGANGPRYRSC